MRPSIASVALLVLLAAGCDRKALFPPSRSSSVAATPPGAPAAAADAGTPSSAGTEVAIALTPAATDLVRVISAPGDQFAPVPSPDGAMLLLEEPGADARMRLHVRTMKDPSKAILVAADTVESRGGAWLPDSTGIVYTSGEGNGFSVVRSGAPLRTAPMIVVAAKQVGYSERVAISPSGQSLCIEVGVADSRSLARVRIDGTELKVLFEGRSPSFSPDGRRVAFIRAVAGYDQVFSALAESGGEVTQLTRDPAHHRAPKFAPNGRYIAFASNAGAERYSAQGGTAEKTWNIHAVRVDGSMPVALTEGRFTSVQPFWGANGKVYFASNASGTFDIYAVTPTGDMGKP